MKRSRPVATQSGVEPAGQPIRAKLRNSRKKPFIMKKTLLALSMMVTLGLSAGFVPSMAFADDNADLAAAAALQPLYGTVQTAAVTGPIQAGGIVYIPCSGSCAGSSTTDSLAPTGGASGNAPFRGTVEAAAVTGPITFGDITYIPMTPSQAARLAEVEAE